MKEWLLEILCCPKCKEEKNPLGTTVGQRDGKDIVEGSLDCKHCKTRYPIKDGIALLTIPPRNPTAPPSKYEDQAVVASYLWSHYGDLAGENEATDAYKRWAELISPASGIGLDAGCAVGRNTFEMAGRMERAVGIDTSLAFIARARELMIRKRTSCLIREEGMISRELKIQLPSGYNTHNVEFVVADAQALPFVSAAFGSVASLNMVDKLPLPLVHLQELDRVSSPEAAQLVISDPFSWSEEVTAPANWLGGIIEGRLKGRGHENLQALLEGRIKGLKGCWHVTATGHVWWKIRNHANHFELIRSCFVKAVR